MIKADASFTQKVKYEIANHDLGSNNQNIAELNAFLSISGSLVFKAGKKFLSANTTNESTAKRIYAIFLDLFGKDFPIDLIVKKEKDSKKYNILIDEEHGIAMQLGINLHKDKKLLNKILKDEDAFSSYFKGLFLASGSINNPQTTFYHLEISTSDKTKSNFICKLLNDFGDFNFKTIKRNNQWVVYAKKADNISDFMKLIGANLSLMEFEDTRIERDFKNSLNRVQNMDIANIEKTIKASNEMILMIKFLKKKNNLSFLEDKGKAIAQLRIEKPELSMVDLAKAFNKNKENNISKSGINHIFRKIKIEYKKYKG